MSVMLSLSSYVCSAAWKTDRLGVELSGGASIAVGKLGGVSLKPGFGFDGAISYGIYKNIGVYAGWGYNRFSPKNDAGFDGISFEETGYVAGLQYIKKLGSSPVKAIFRGGLLYNHIEIEVDELDMVFDTGHGVGMQLSAGVLIPLAKKWDFSATLKYHNFNREYNFEGMSSNLNLEYLGLRVGIVRYF